MSWRGKCVAPLRQPWRCLPAYMHRSSIRLHLTILSSIGYSANCSASSCTLRKGFQPSLIAPTPHSLLPFTRGNETHRPPPLRLLAQSHPHQGAAYQYHSSAAAAARTL